MSKLSKSLKQLGQIQVTDWELRDVMNKDIGDLELTRSLRRLGKIRVMEWDFKDFIPAVNKLAHKEVDVADWLKRTASYKVMEWDFRSNLPTPPKSHPLATRKAAQRYISPSEMQAIILRLKNFLQYVLVQLIDEPGHAQIKVQEIQPNVLRFKLVMVQRDVAMLIGKGGHTAAAIRNTLKAAAEMNDVQVLLRILSHEEESQER